MNDKLIRVATLQELKRFGVRDPRLNEEENRRELFDELVKQYIKIEDLADMQHYLLHFPDYSKGIHGGIGWHTSIQLIKGDSTKPRISYTQQGAICNILEYAKKYVSGLEQQFNPPYYALVAKQGFNRVTKTFEDLGYIIEKIEQSRH